MLEASARVDDRFLTLGVIGGGFVGQATSTFGESHNIKTLIYDIDPERCSPSGTTLGDLIRNAAAIFICVPTPMVVGSGQCDTSIVEKVVQTIRNHQDYEQHQPKLVVRSTVPPGTCESLNVAHMPEYLTEAKWLHDFRVTKIWELGVQPDDHQTPEIIQRALDLCVKNQVIESSTLVVRHTNVTEMAKYMRNTLLAGRVAICNEYAAFCRAQGIEYEQVRQLATSDARIGPAHTKVPGPDGKLGFGGTCLPKDLRGLIYEMMRAGTPPMVLMACANRNDLIDRPSLDWMHNVGRSVSLPHLQE